MSNDTKIMDTSSVFEYGYSFFIVKLHIGLRFWKLTRMNINDSSSRFIWNGKKRRGDVGNADMQEMDDNDVVRLFVDEMMVMVT